MHTVRVLIADPEAEFTAVLTDRLHSWGFAAMAANDKQRRDDFSVRSRVPWLCERAVCRSASL